MFGMFSSSFIEWTFENRMKADVLSVSRLFSSWRGVLEGGVLFRNIQGSVPSSSYIRYTYERDVPVTSSCKVPLWGKY